MANKAGSVTQAILAYLEIHSGVTVKQIAADLGEKPQIVSALTSQLWTQGRIDRMPNPERIRGFLYGPKGFNPEQCDIKPPRHYHAILFATDRGRLALAKACASYLEHKDDQEIEGLLKSVEKEIGAIRRLLMYHRPGPAPWQEGLRQN